jgi:formylmethanofuran dehydrogenase subunit E
MNKDNKNTELDNTDKKLHISDVMCCFCGKLHKQAELIDDKPICETCYEQGYNFDFKNWLILERTVLK